MCAKSELDLFNLPLTDESSESGDYLEIHPVSSTKDGGVIEFVVPPASGDYYYDVANTLLYLVVQLVVPSLATGEAAPAVPKAGPVNNWPHALFDHIQVLLNGKDTTSGSHCYGYKAYIDTILGYDLPAQQSHLTTRLFAKDTAFEFNSRDARNKGYEARANALSDNRSVDIISNLHCDFFGQERYLINGVEMKLRLHRSKTAFHVMASRDAQVDVRIHTAKLLIRRVKINPSILLAHHKALESASAKYPITRVDMKVLTLNAGIRSKVMDSVYLGPQPRRVVMGLVDNNAFNGDLEENPWNFVNSDVCHLAVFSGGNQIPSQPLTPDFTHPKSPLYVTAYHSLFSGTGIHFKDEGININRSEYPGGYCLYAFDLTPNLSSHTGLWNLQKTGSLRIEIRFKSELAKAVNLIVYSEFDSLIEIDKYRNVQTDFAN